MLAILCTDGQMDHTDVRKECKSGKWAPIFVWRDGDKTVVPLFNDEKVAKTFIRRNLPADWLKGAVLLTDADLQTMKDKGWQIEEMSFPRLIKDLPITLSFEIIDFNDEPEMICR